MSAITIDDLRQLMDLSVQLSNSRLCGDEEDAEADEDSLIGVMRRCLQRDDDVADDDLDRHIDRVLRAAGSALRHYTMQKSLDDMRAAMRAAMTPVPLFDSQCRELCAALGWQGGTYWKVLAEVKRLKAAELARSDAGSALSLRPRRGEIDLLRWVADDISRQVGEGHGVWRSCSGCHELNEGHDTGPYSHTFRCALGRGCSECGGIGAVWDTTDYQALADAQMGQLTGAVNREALSPAAPAQIHWINDGSLPAAHDLVLIDAGSKGVWPGGYDAGQWVDAGGNPFEDDQVVAWARMPKGSKGGVE